jgi:hypothetical protein
MTRYFFLLVVLCCTAGASGQNAPAFDRSVKSADNFEAAIPRPEQDEASHMHIDLATVQDVGLAPWFFNLYLDPKEEMTVGHRRDPWMAMVPGKLKAHGASLEKYPPKNIGL